MNSKQAKELDLVEFVARMGHTPSKTRGNDIWYRSPFRPEERTPSFKIDAQKNIWYDFGMGQGGTIIDLVQNLYRTPDISQVLAIITDVAGGASRALAQPHPVSASEAPREKPVIDSVSPITDRLLEAYLAERAIPLHLARMYLQEIAYRVGDRSYRALAFGNDAGGYEIRNPGFKGTLGTKDITYLVENSGRADASVFEGAFDFLSALAHYGRERPKSNVLVLNSVGMVDRAIGLLSDRGITKLSAYLDHDKAGEHTATRLREGGSWEFSDESGLYLGYKDMNDFLVK
jgi:hypothetical protein